jgi:hypothetical protein
MRVRAGVAPRVASGDPAASKGKSAGVASFGKRRVGRESKRGAQRAATPVFVFLAASQVSSQLSSRQQGKEGRQQQRQQQRRSMRRRRQQQGALLLHAAAAAALAS